MLKTFAAIVAAAGFACAAAPASTPTPLIAPGVSISGVRVGGLSAEPARARIEHVFSRAITIRTPDGVARVSPDQVGARSSIAIAVTSALAATPGSAIKLPTKVSSERIDAVVSKLAHRYDYAPVDTTLTGADGEGPIFTAPKAGRAVDTKTMRVALGQALRSSGRQQLLLLTHPVPAKKTVANFGPVIVISRGANRLTLYDGANAVRTFRVATGQAIYPTPAGLWHIMDMQRNPWWYPPTNDDWAKGLKPVPPGPSNPLGTRWMGLNAPGVGIHGTDAPASIGYSASHGCVRMQVPEAEWLFEHVSVGTPVVIL
ncbi:MAG TPA: L,D-transpeptidase [Gaiellaceae bacterium]|nr:L,D-transpeptidase [Gaiellaceae bacterium]